MRLNGVEAGRGIASLLVLLVHASHMVRGPEDFGRPPFAGLFEFGHAGVDFFFVLSGFIIYFVHHADIGRPAALRPYAIKRAIRIYPVYWAALGVLGAILIVSPTPDRAEQHLGTIVTSVFLLPAHADPILGVAWSLRHELIFYSLFALLILHRGVGWIVLAAWGAGTGANVLTIFLTGTSLFDGVAASLFFRIFNLEFFVGLLAARAVLTGRVPVPRLLAIAGAALFFGGGVYESWVSTAPPEWLPRHLVYAIGSGLIIAGLAAAERADPASLPVPRPFLVLGRASYSLYLIHVIVLIIVAHVLRLVPDHAAFPAELGFLVEVCVAVAAGVAFCRTVEQPLLRLARRRLLSAPTAGAVVSETV